MKKICTVIFIIMLNPIFFFSHAQGIVNSQRLLPVQVNGVWGFINLAGKIAITPQFDSEEEFSEGLASVVQEGKYGYVDKTGNMAIQPSFSKAFKFENGIAKVYVGKKMGYIDKTGKYIWEPTE